VLGHGELIARIEPLADNALSNRGGLKEPENNALQLTSGAARMDAARG